MSANNKIAFEGLDELRQALRNLPSEMTTEAAGIVDRRAQNAAAAIKASYAEDSGNLRDGVSVAVDRPDTLGVVATVRSRSKHAHLYEFGSQVRRTASGANRGQMPSKPTVIPIAQRERTAMNRELVDLLKRAGFEVSGG